jgi:hypothetical protein
MMGKRVANLGYVSFVYLKKNLTSHLLADLKPSSLSHKEYSIIMAKSTSLHFR